MHCPHPSTPSKLIKNVYIYKQENGHLIQTVLIFLLLWQGIKKENTADSLLRFLPWMWASIYLKKYIGHCFFVRECWTTLSWRCCYYYSLKCMSKYVGWHLKESWAGEGIWVVSIWMGGISCCTVFSSLALTNSSCNWQGFGSTFSLGSCW